MPAQYNLPGYYYTAFFQPDYWDIQAGFIGHIVAYSPHSGTTVDFNVRPYVIFDQSIQSGSLLFTLTQSGGTPVVGTTTFNPVLSTETFIPNSPLAFPMLFNAFVSGIDSQGSFTFTWPFFTLSGSVANPLYNIILTLPGKILQPTYSYILNINHLKNLKVRN